MNLALVAPDERACAAVADGLAEHANVQVFTTCVGPEQRRGRYYDPGTSVHGSAVFHRFRCDASRVPSLEERLRRAALAADAAQPLQERWAQERGPYSSALLEHIDAHREELDAFVFFELESATTVFGLPRAGPSILAPRVLDWNAVPVEMLRTVATRARGLLFDSEQERSRAVAALGVEAPMSVAGDASPAAVLGLVDRVLGDER